MNNKDIKKHIKESLREKIDELLIINNNEVFIDEPYDNIQTIDINGNKVYILFGDVDYYQNKDAILAIKNKNNLTVNKNYYNNFLKEFNRRFYSIESLNSSDMVVSIETTAPINIDMIKSTNKPNVTNGFKKIDSGFKMKDIDIENRKDITNIFYKDFNHDNANTICVVDDFLTSGTSFKNAFDVIPDNINKVGVALFRLKS